MSNRIFERDGDTMVIRDGNGGGNGGSWDGLGGIGAIIALVVVVAILWFLAREGRGNDGCYGGGGYAPYPHPPYPPYPPYGGGGNCCNSPLDCKIPMAPDMSNCEVDKDLWKIDAHMEKCCCETQKEILADGGKTRELISANYLQDLRDKLSEKNSEVQALKTQQYADAKFDALNAKLCKEDCETDKQFGYLAGAIKELRGYIDCNIPKLPPRWCDSITPNTHHVDCQHGDFPKRAKGCCDNDGCGCGYGYGFAG